MSKSLSDLDLGGVLRSSHDSNANSLRIVNGISEVPTDYTKTEISYGTNGSVSSVKFYKGVTNQITDIRVSADISGSLNSKYFRTYTQTESYVFYFSLNGTGVDPEIADTKSIPVVFEENDSSLVIAALIKNEANFLQDFKATSIGDLVTIENNDKGQISDFVDINTGFSFSRRQEGISKFLKIIEIPSSDYLRYLFNEQEKKFQVESIINASSGNSVSISGHLNKEIVLQDNDILGTSLNTSTFTSIFTYTATDIVNFKLMKTKSDTAGLLQLTLDGVIQDYFRVTASEVNGRFEFAEDLTVSVGSVLEIKFRPDTISLPSYNFFTRAEGYK